MNRFLLLSLIASATFLPSLARAADQPPEGFGFGAYMTHETTKEGNTIINKSTYHMISQYDPHLKDVLTDHAGTKLDENGKPIEDIKLLPAGGQEIYFVRTEKTKNNEATLRFISPLSISGCANVVPPAITTRKGGNMIAFKVDDGAVALDKSVRYAHYQCNQGNHVASADVTLNRDELLENNIKTLTFQNGSGTMDTYSVDLSGNRLTLVPKTSYSFKPFEGSGKTDPLTYYFYPDNVVMLYAPGAGKKADLSEQIIALAKTKGLVPASSAPLNSRSAIYFVDQQGTLANSLAFDANAFVGTVEEQQAFQGPGGSYEKDKPVDVYAKRPGLLD